MTAIVTLLVITVVSLLVVRAGATALMMTGLTWDTASFQSYSAFFGVGFTMREAEYGEEWNVRAMLQPHTSPA